VQHQVFVGREQELSELGAHLDRAMAGTGRICFISGQAGAGKTALVRHFVSRAQDTDDTLVVAAGACNAHDGLGDPYLPFREALNMLTDPDAAQQAASKLSPENTNRLRSVLVRSVQVLVEVAPELVGLFVPGASLVGALGRAVAKKTGWMDHLDDLVKKKAVGAGTAETLAEQSRIFEQYTAFLQKLADKIPLILFLDDLQWADSASLSLLFHLGRHVESDRILILGAFRPDDVSLGRNGERHPLEAVVNELTRYHGDVVVDLDAMPEEANRQFVNALIDSEPNCFADGFKELLYQQTEGHALFTVELLRAMEERGDLVRDADGCWVEGPSLDWNQLPARVEGVIEERIRRLSPDHQELLQVASIQGEEFSAEVVARVQNLADRDVIWQLSRELQRRHRLVDAVGVLQQGRVRLARYAFAHSLFQQYLYNSLTEAERVYLHTEVAQVLEALFCDETEQVAAQLARHFELALAPAEAAAYRLQAGNLARRLSAHQEAAAHLTRGLELVAQLPPGPDQIKLELELQVSLGKALLAMYGYASPQVDRVFARARELFRVLGDPPEVVQVLLAQAAFHLMRGSLANAHADAGQVLQLAGEAGDTGSMLTAHLILGTADLYRADYDKAHHHLEQVVALYDPVEHRALAYQQGQDPAVQAVSFISRILWLQGHPQQALDKCAEGMDLAGQLDHPYSSTIAVLHASTLRAWLRWWPESQAYAEEALALARKGSFKMREANAAVLHGIALAHQGHTRQGLAELTQGLYLWAASGAGLVAYGRACLAEAYWLDGQHDEGLRAADEALYPNEEAWWLPEQYRLRAELLLLAPGGEAEAEALFRQAADLAHSQGARSLELRALTGLARLLRQQGRAPEAHDLLAECYASFTERPDAPDLQEARELLAELAAQPAPEGIP
jgi:predicted ATPase